MLRFSFFFILGTLAASVMGQNLISNSSFEIYTNRNNDTRDIQFCSGWEYSMSDGIITSTPNLIITDYTEDKFTKRYGVIPAHTGICYAAILSGEFIIYKFQKKLKKDSIYLVSFWYSLSPKTDHYTSCWSYRFITEDSLCFHDTKLEAKQRKNVFYALQNALINIDCDSCMFYGWHKQQFYYKANGNEAAFMLGVYFPSSFTKRKYECEELLPKGQVKVSSGSLDVNSMYYYIDDVSIEKSKPPLEIGKTVITRDILFANGSSTIDSKSFVYLNTLADYLLLYPDLKIEIRGHTDNVGSTVANQKLSEDRANAVRMYFIERGVDGDRIISKGYGATKPVASNHNEEGRALNRRIEITIFH